MKLRLAGFEEDVDILKDKVSVLEVENRILFTRVCQSLLSGKGELALEPYSIWDDDKNQLTANKVFEVIASPFNLPWTGREFGGKLYTRLEAFVLEEDDIRQKIEAFNRELTLLMLSLNIQMHSEYTFTSEWDIKKYLKAFGFGADTDFEERLLDNLIKFFEMAVDVGFKNILVFINLKQFFSKIELEELYEQVIFLGIRILLLESMHDESKYTQEKKSLIDQHFLQ